MVDQTDINVLIVRLISGEGSAEEKERIAEWLGQSAENRKLYADIKEIWLSAGTLGNADHYDLEGAIMKFRKQIQGRKPQPKARIGINQYLKYAALAFLLVALPFSYYLGIRNAGADDSLTTISCAFGDRSSIVLPDSSKVWLNGGSKISFNSGFRNNERRVILEGEAFFAVSKDKHHPFVVKTKDIQVKVLGTSFNLKAYPEEGVVSATLVEGSLLVSSEDQEIRLKPDEKLVFDRGNNQMTLESLTDTSPETEWKDGRFVFRNESLGELAPKLSRWFDVDIVFIDEQAKERRFTGVLERENILEAISYFDRSTLISCKTNGSSIEIKSENN